MSGISNTITGLYHYIFNSTNNTWTRINDLLYRFSCKNSIIYRDKLYLYGTDNISDTANRYYCYMWNEKTDTWEQVVPLKDNNPGFPFYYLGSVRVGTVVYNDAINILGVPAASNTGSSNIHISYKPTWNEKIIEPSACIFVAKNTEIIYDKNNTAVHQVLGNQQETMNGTLITNNSKVLIYGDNLYTLLN